MDEHFISVIQFIHTAYDLLFRISFPCSVWSNISLSPSFISRSSCLVTYKDWNWLIASYKPYHLNVLKRTATEAHKVSTSTLWRVPLEYAILVDTLPEFSQKRPRLTHYTQGVDVRKLRAVHVVDGACTNRIFCWVFDNIQPCGLPNDWDHSDTAEPRSTANALTRNLLPCFLMQKHHPNSRLTRRVVYFRGVKPQDIYATYSKATVQKWDENMVVNVTRYFLAIIRRGWK